MNEELFLKKMKEDVLDTEMDIKMDTLLEDIDEWDSLSVVSFITFAKSVERKVKKNNIVNVKTINNAKTMRDLFDLLQ